MKWEQFTRGPIPCECGSLDAYWHGDTRRVYCCDTCWHAAGGRGLGDE